MMEKILQEGGIAAMTMDFIRRAGGGEEAARLEAARLCGQLFDEQDSGSVCLQVSEKECETLLASGLVSAAPDLSGLFVLNRRNRRLYTRRNWRYEEALFHRIRRMLSDDAPLPVIVPEEGLKPCQREAVKVMCSHRFSILTGGPGTGKTYTIAHAVKLIASQCGDPAIGLAAPTGKAAARLLETMQETTKKIGLDREFQTSTLHSLLQPRSDLVTFKHDRNNPLPLDWLIVDEASMIDLPLMAKLLDALPENCRLTLVGDANQLASVEAGRVFGDLCSISELRSCIAELTESTRLKNAPEIFTLAEAVKTGDADRALTLLDASLAPRLRFRRLTAAPKGNPLPGFFEAATTLWQEMLDARTPEQALEALNSCRILCAMRQGTYGCGQLNLLMRKIAGETSPVPMMITANNGTLNVSNGETGVLMPGENRLHLMQGGKLRTIPLALLPDLETAFATTIHKSQGSEFDSVILVLPPGASAPEGANRTEMLTRELLYTAITRTKGELLLYGDDDAIRCCCQHKISRCTGLPDFFTQEQ